MKFTQYPVLIVVWTQDGCPACEDYKPRFARIAERYASCVPAVILNAAQYMAAADYYRVETTPTTMLLRQGQRSVFTLHGAADDAAIDSYFQSAMHGLDCQVG